jgi:integrase
LSLFQPPDSRYWWYSFNFEGKRYRSSTKQTKKAAAAVVEATLLVRLREGALSNVQRKKPPTLREFSLRFLEWVESSQRLSPNGKRYYRYGWRLLSYTKLPGMSLEQITQDIAESVVFRRPVIDRAKKDSEGKCVVRSEMVLCTGHYINQALRTLKRMQGKAVEWKVLRERPKITMAEAPGRDRLIDDKTEDHLELAYRIPTNHRRTERMREQAWLVMVILQDCGMRPDEVFPMQIENLHWDANRIWIPEGKTEKARRLWP